MGLSLEVTLTLVKMLTDLRSLYFDDFEIQVAQEGYFDGISFILDEKSIVPSPLALWESAYTDLYFDGVKLGIKVAQKYV